MKHVLCVLALLMAAPAVAGDATIDQIRSIVEKNAPAEAGQIDWDRMSHLSKMQLNFLLMGLSCSFGKPVIFDAVVKNGLLVDVHVVCN